MSRLGRPPCDRDDEDIVAAVAIGGEGDVPAVRAEDGVEIVCLVHGHRPGHAADGLHDPDITQVAEGDVFSVR